MSDHFSSLTQRLRLLRLFIGHKVLRLLLLGLAVGLALFIVEILFAYILESFFLVLGVASAENLRIPHWVPQKNPTLVIGSVLLVGCARGLLYWAQQYLPHATLQESGYHQRSRILHWVFQSKTVSSSQTITLFNELNNGTAFALMAAQNLSVAAISVFS